MIKADIPVALQLKKLYELQQIDSQINEFEILKGELPVEVSDLEDELAGLDTRASKLDDSIKNVEKEVSHFQLGIKESKTLIGKYEKQLDTVKNNREYDALMKEIELQKLEIELFNKKIKDTEVQSVVKDDQLKATKEKIKQKNKDLEQKKVELDELIAKTEEDVAKLTKKSDKAKKDIDGRLLEAYSRIKKNYRNSLGVVTVQRDSCGGCFNKIPPQTQLEISQHKKVLVCEHCGRILVDESITTVEA
ncbi:MAG: C4-type zinc ribbon domain-containing protein [Saprospiraceae bacterium]